MSGAQCPDKHEARLQMSLNQRPDAEDEAFWRDLLTNGDSRERRVRLVFKRIPTGPRCRLCAAPFAGIGAPLMAALGRKPSDQNPNMCTSCFRFITGHHGGAEIECTMLFADIRGSTTIAEGMSPEAYHGLLDRFYTVATDVVFAHDGAIDKFVGDELVAMFFPLLSGERHAARGVAAAQALLRATDHAATSGAWVPIGAGVHTAQVWFGAVGQGAHVELTAVGDAMNVTARLASLAAAGEVLVTTDAAAAAGLPADMPHRTIALRGKEQPTDVVSLGAT